MKRFVKVRMASLTSYRHFLTEWRKKNQFHYESLVRSWEHQGDLQSNYPYLNDIFSETFYLPFCLSLCVSVIIFCSLFWLSFSQPVFQCYQDFCQDAFMTGMLTITYHKDFLILYLCSHVPGASLIFVPHSFLCFFINKHTNTVLGLIEIQ